MQSCPKNVHTGPLTGDSKRSGLTSISKESMPLPPVALALPLEPASATGPPSPARGSAGMPPPPSPAGATYQPPPPVAPKHEEEPIILEKKRKARVGKAMVRNHIEQNTMLLMCNPQNQRVGGFPNEVKREIESPKEKETKKEICSDEDQEQKARLAEQPQILKQEQCDEDKMSDKKKVEEEGDDEEKSECETVKEVLLCTNTVAENVKMKNMKRKLSLSKEKPEIELPVQKKNKIEQVKYTPGSYKDLIKKDSSIVVKINNGKRKLMSEEEDDGSDLNEEEIKQSKTKVKKTLKRKLLAEEIITNNKRPKSTKPLTASNQQNSKQYSKETNKTNTNELIENKEPRPVQKLKKLTRNKKVSSDSLLPRNSIEKTIESVVCETKSRTTTGGGVLKSADGKCALKTRNESKRSTKNGGVLLKTNGKIECRKSVSTNRRKSKSKEVVATVPQFVARVPRRSLHLPRWSNGWMWEGRPYEAKVFLNVSIF